VTLPRLLTLKFDRVNRMAQDLETLKTEMEAYLKQYGMAVFHGYHRMIDTMSHVLWDTTSHPDFRDFLQTARHAGVRLVVFNHRSFSLDQLDEALDELEDADLLREEKRSYETRLRQLQAYEGFTCSVELSFAIEGRVYSFESHTDWYEAFTDILGELEAASFDHEDEPDDSIGGYFSNN
jgi:hypothetical protein